MSARGFFARSLALLALLGIFVAASAEGASTQVLDKPVYDPEAKRYFVLMPSNPEHDAWGTQYEKVDKMARDQVFHGVHGRLAIVDSIQVHEFLLRTFHPDQFIWIGLRYLCKQRQLQWSDGHLWKPGDFQAWDANWNQDVYFCANGVWSPIAYALGTFRWIGKGPGKGYDYAFVEFPTGQP